MGDAASLAVSRANAQVSRLVLLMMLSVVLHNAVFIIEQPSSSILEWHTRWKALNDVLGMLRLHMWMQPYGGSSRKGTLLYSNTSRLGDLWRPLDSSQTSSARTYEVYVDVGGNVRTQGTSELKGTQAYPAEFGRAVASLYANILTEPASLGLPIDRLGDLPASDDLWADAGLEQVLAELRATVS